MEPSANQYRNDLEFLFHTIEEVHPRPSFRASQERLENEKRYCLSQVDACKSIEDFWRLATRYLRCMGDGHTYLLYSRDPNSKRLGISTCLVQGAVVVDKVYDSHDFGIERGDVVLSIAGQEVAYRLEEAMAAQIYNNVEWGRHQAARNLVHFPDSHLDSVEVIWAKPCGRVVSRDLPVLPANHECFHSDWFAERLASVFEVKLLDDVGAGYLAYRSCMDRTTCAHGWWRDELATRGLGPDDVPDMEEVCWRLFADMRARGFHSFILDLRGNSGGNSAVAEVLYKYLTQKPLRSYGVEVKISKQVTERNPRLASEPLGSIKAYPERSITYPYRSRLTSDQINSLQQFLGAVYVLIDTNVFSSGEWLAADLAANELGLLVGEPTGGGGSVPGDQIQIELPRTKLQLYISYKFFRKPSTRGQDYPGVLPDFWVPQSLVDYQSGRDTALAFVKDMIRERTV